MAGDALAFDEAVRKARLFYIWPERRRDITLRLTWQQTELLRDMLDCCETDYDDGRDRAMARRIRVGLHRAEIATLPVEGLQYLEVSPQRRLERAARSGAGE